MLYHGINEKCPNVINGEWSRCMGHSDNEASTVCLIWEVKGATRTLVEIYGDLSKAIVARDTRQDIAKKANPQTRLSYNLQTWRVK